MPRKKRQPYGLSAHRAAKRYEVAVKPYHQVIEKLRLPKRGEPGSAVNYERVALIARAMAFRKLQVARARAEERARAAAGG